MDTYIQQVKLENREELSNLHSTIASLREQLENSKFVTGEAKFGSIKVTKLINLNQQSRELRIQLEKQNLKKKVKNKFNLQVMKLSN